MNQSNKSQCEDSRKYDKPESSHFFVNAVEFMNSYSILPTDPEPDK